MLIKILKKLLLFTGWVLVISAILAVVALMIYIVFFLGSAVVHRMK